jgi:hypothetical protein
MRFLAIRCLLLPAGCLLLHSGVTGQLTRDSAVLQAETRAIAVYHTYMGDQAPVYNGIMDLSYVPDLQGSPYFHSNELVKGAVFYDGIQYSDISMRYDLVRDQLIIGGRTGNLTILFRDKVEEFSLYGHLFKRISQGDLQGFYDLLCSGKVQILARRTKKIEESIIGTELIHKISATDLFFAVKDGQFHSIGNERGLLRLMSEKKEEVSQFIRSNRIKFRKDPEQAIVKITAYYNQLFL